MSEALFKGVFPALVTPFRDGAVDEDAFVSLVERQIAGGVPGLVPVGTTGQTATLSASGSAPSDLLLFVLTARPNQLPPLDRPAIVKELYRTPDPLPDLRAGPYEFSLARVTFPAAMPATSAHYRSGAALDYVLAGTAALAADGKTEAVSAEMALLERFGWVHRWANPGDQPLVLLQANISRDGDPATHPVDEQ